MVSQIWPIRLSDIRAADFARVAVENPLILLSLGSHEDHGFHLPMGDFALADELAGRMATAARLAGVAVFVAPAMPYGVTDFFAASPGAMAVSAAVFRGLLQDLLNGLIAQRLTRIVILNGHGGNAPVIHEVTLGIRNGGGPVIPSLYLWKLARAMMEKHVGSQNFGHGAEPLASLNAALRPDLVDFTNTPAAAQKFELGLAASGLGTVDFQGFAVEVPTGFIAGSDAAIRAAAGSASAALGEQIAAELVAYGAAFMAHFAGITE